MVGSGEGLEATVKLFREKGISSAPVITPMGEVIGHLTEMVLVKALVMNQVQSENNNKIIHFKYILEKINFVQDSDHVSDVLKVLIQSSSHRVLVKDDKNNIVGIISPKDLIRNLSGHFEVREKKEILQEMEELQEELENIKEKMTDMESYMDMYDSVFQSGVYMLHSANPEGTHFQVYSSMVKKTGEVLRIDVVSASLKDKDGEFSGTFTISRQIESDHLLRSLHGLIKDDSKYGTIKK